MFSGKNKTIDGQPSSGTTIIGAGTLITGDITSSADIRIDGTLNGNVNAESKILIGSNGVVNGNISGNNADVAGAVYGTVQVSELLNLRGNASVRGDVYAGKLQVEPTVTFNGQCHMGANVVELNKEKAMAVNQ
jgi:cytoskeletal protein CcmA (bactofilin family)